MNAFRCTLGWRIPAVLAAAGWVGMTVAAAEPAAAPKVDGGKRAVERPLKAVLAATPATPPAGKAAAPPFTNPTVQPGKVRWHDSWAAACAASRRSGKPVLLFQMMGRLDQRFC